MSPTSAPARVLYSERLVPSAGTHLVVLVAALGLALAASLFGGAAALLTGVLVLAVGSGVLVATSPVVEVTDDGDPADGGAPGEPRLRAGGAVIPVGSLGPAEVLDAEGLRRAMGPASDPRDHVCHRPWVHSGVRLPVVDPRDPTPAWVMCTRRPAQLLAALGRREG